METEYKLVITKETLERYNEYYFKRHPRAYKEPIRQPYQESVNVWMIMKRPMMNSLKQKWKDFISWVVEEQGYSNLRIDECDIHQRVYYSNNRRHDPDNSVPKFIIDGLVCSGMIVDDDLKHIKSLTLSCAVDKHNPRTELEFTVYKFADASEDEGV